jgi:pyruvate dehydrogenase E2 component (dihydrolipoamide acetyltransferase)
MATKVVMEALSPTMEEGRLVKWLKHEGDAVKSGDVLAEVETDKAVMELAARGDGVIRKVLAAEGDASPVGTLLAVIAPANENIDAILAEAGSRAAAGGNGAEPSKSAEQTVAGATEQPSAGAAPQQAAESQAEASTAPQSAVATAPPAGSPAAPPRPAATPGPAQPVARPPAPPSGQARPPAPTPAPPPPPPARSGDGRQRSSPLARRLASERGIDLGAVAGSGPGGRVVKRDVESWVAPPAAAQRGKPAAPPRKRLITREGDYQDIPLTQIRKTIARRLVESIGPVPTFYLTAEFDAARAAELRGQLKDLGDEYKLSFNDIVLKAVASALSEHPEVNAHWMGDRIRHFNRVHVAMAVAVEEGLITPVIFDADRKSVHEIAGEARELAELARLRKLTPEQYTGSTFSVSNLGMFGIDQFTAIINPPEAGILAVGAVEEKPVVIDGQIVVRPRMRVTMSCDHRVIDGATGALFLQTVRRLIENPLLLIFPSTQ